MGDNAILNAPLSSKYEMIEIVWLVAGVPCDLRSSISHAVS